MQKIRRDSIERHGSVTGSVTNRKPQKPQWMKDVFKFMDSGEVQLFLGVLLMLSLFMSDCWILGNAPDSQNEVLYGILMFVVVIFSFEVIILSVVQEDYFNSFFFWMDFLGTVSILLDIGWVSEAFLSGESVKSGSVLRATRAAKLGARYGRILRLMKLMKLTKWCPCLKSNVGDDVKAEPTLSAVVKISNELTGTISRRVALLVVTIVIVVPFLAYTPQDYSAEAYLSLLQSTARSPNCTMYDINQLISKFDNFYNHKDSKLYEITVNSPYYSCGGTYDVGGNVVSGAVQTSTFQSFNPGRKVTKVINLFEIERDFGFMDSNYEVRATMDATVPDQWTALFGIILMILVIGVLFGFSASFHTSIEKLVVVPLQKLMSTLRKSATVMIDSLKSLEKEKAKDEADEGLPPAELDDEDDEDVEAAVLEHLVEKLSKIVKHVLPTSNDIVANTENVDKATADWLNQQYTSGNSGGANAAGVADVNVEIFENEEDSSRKATRKRMCIIKLGKFSDENEIDSWEFDVLATRNHEQCFDAIEYIFEVSFNFFDEFKIPQDVFYNFMTSLSKRYINTNPYHHFKHAVDVCHTSYRLMKTAELCGIGNRSGVLSHLEIFSVLIAALGHDVGHPAVNNGYLVKTKHTLAFQHNDKSPLENMHCVVLYEILSSSLTTTVTSLKGTTNRMKSSLTIGSGEEDGPRSLGCNIFANFTDAQWRESRKVILGCILGTDMVHHFEQVKKTQLFHDLNGENIMQYYSGETDTMECLSSDANNRMFVMELILHCSDISNPFKPFDICAKWADLVMDEFFSQGDKERELGIDISPGFDRNTTNLYNMQMGFIEFVVQPLITAVIQIFPPLTQIGENMLTNFLAWGQKRIEEIPKDDKVEAENKASEIAKLQDRLNKFREKMSFMTGCMNQLADARQHKKLLTKGKRGSMEITK